MGTPGRGFPYYAPDPEISNPGAEESLSSRFRVLPDSSSYSAASLLMRQETLEPKYDARFVDDQSYPPTTPFLLRGLAAAILQRHAADAPPVALWTPHFGGL
jgi:hypothetical protein